MYVGSTKRSTNSSRETRTKIYRFWMTRVLIVTHCLQRPSSPIGLALHGSPVLNSCEAFPLCPVYIHFSMQQHHNIGASLVVGTIMVEENTMKALAPKTIKYADRAGYVTTWWDSMLALQFLAGEYCPAGHAYMIDAASLEGGEVIASFICNDCHYITTFSSLNNRIPQWEATG